MAKKHTVKKNEKINQKLIIFFICLVLALSVSYIQYLTGPELTLTLFYLFPIMLAIWRAGIWAGIAVSFLSAGLWFLTDLVVINKFSNRIIPYFNATFRLIGFLVITYIVSELKNSYDKQRDLAWTDPLTGISNKRAFIELSSVELHNARRYNNSFSVLCLDLDNFKYVNDNLGHKTGDRLLVTVTDTISRNIRKIDIFGRLGGDEFAILLSRTNAETAFLVANKLKERLLKEMGKEGWPVTFSVGLATFQNAPESVEEMIDKADILMYTAKRNGKNMIKHLIIND